MTTVLLADDDAAIVTVLTRALEKHGLGVRTATAGDAMMRQLQAGVGDVLLMDVMMPFAGEMAESFDWMDRIKTMRPELPVVIMSARGGVMSAVKANRLGAYEFIQKPFDLNNVVATLKAALNVLPPASSAAAHAPKLEEMMGNSPAMQKVHRLISRVVDNDLTVMITGESGTGKELVAKAIHQLGNRANKPFMAINMAAIPRELVESELFGHEKGAFTGAAQRKAGLFEQAKGGTLFLDEIGDMPVEAQSKLLRVLQQGEFTTVGGTKLIKAEARIICATHRDLLEKVTLGAFREDLYYRLNVVPIHVPPLRERLTDIPAIAEHILTRAATRGLPERRFEAGAVERLMQCEWPGNVRELENTLYRLMALSPSPVITVAAVAAELPHVQVHAPMSLEALIAEHLQNYFAAHLPELPPKGVYDRILPLLERPLLEQVLKATNGNQLKAAAVLGINRNTLKKRMDELGVKS